MNADDLALSRMDDDGYGCAITTEAASPARCDLPAVSPGMVLVWAGDDDRGGYIEVTVQEAAAGMMRYARTLGPGTPACGVVEQRALELLRSHGYGNGR